MTASAVGEFRSHGLGAYTAEASASESYTLEISGMEASNVAMKHSHDHSHSHSHSHTHQYDSEGKHFKHDASNHHHAYDSASAKLQYLFPLARLTASEFSSVTDGSPSHKPFKIERPPKNQLFV